MTQDTKTHEENDSKQKESTPNKVIGHPISTSILNADNELLRSYSHSKRVGNYLLGKTLGEGSFAKVKEALHALTTTKVAVKVIDKKKATKDSYVRKNLRREGRILQTVRHANVAHLYEIMETENYYYLVLELCEGGDLMDRIYKLKRLEEQEVRKHMRQIISAVEYLHRAGIIHRDLKIENLLLSEHNDVKIIDFGLSNTVKVSSSTSLENRPKECLCQTQCGSPAYAAPELLANKKYGPEVDVWSIGVNMYAMLTGTLPFTVSPFNIQTLQNKMMKGEMNPIPDHVSNGCRDLLLRLLAPDPNKRVTLQQAMSHPWIKNGKNGGILIPSKFPNKLRQSELDGTILSHIADKLKFRTAEVSQIAVNNTPHPYLATYMLLKSKLDRWRVKAARDEKMDQASKASRPNKVLPFKRRQAQNVTTIDSSTNGTADDHPSTTETAAHKPQSPKRVAVVRPTEKVPDLARKNSEVKTKPVQVVLPARRCESVVEAPGTPVKDVVTDVMSPRDRTADLTKPSGPLADPPSFPSSTAQDQKSKIDLTKPLDMRQKTDPNLLIKSQQNPESSKTITTDKVLEARNRIAPVRLLGQGPYVIRNHPRPELPPSEKPLDYDEWRQTVMRRNVVDPTKYDSFARTNGTSVAVGSKPALPLPTTDTYDLGKYSRPKPSLLKPNNKLVNGYENNPMMKMLHKRSTQPNVSLYDSKDEKPMFTRQSTDLSDLRNDKSDTSNLALPSICSKPVLKKNP